MPQEDKLPGGDKSGEEMPDWVADKQRRAARRYRQAEAELEAEAQATAEAKLKVAGRCGREAGSRGTAQRRAACRTAFRNAGRQGAEELHRSAKAAIMKSKDGFVQAYNVSSAGTGARSSLTAAP